MILRNVSALNPRVHRSSCRGSRRQPTDFHLRLGPSTSGLRGLVIQACHRAGIRRVHDRSITSPRQVHLPVRPDPVPDRGHREPLRRHAAVPAARVCRSSIPAAATGTRPIPDRSLDGMTRDRSGSPLSTATGTNKPRPAAQREQNSEEPNRPRCPAHQSDEQPRRPDNGQNGRRSAKRAVTRTACSAWTLSAICP